jgi:hypothetical protein
MISRFDLQLSFANSIDGPLTHSPKPKEGSSATAADLSSTHTNPAAATSQDPHDPILLMHMHGPAAAQR